MTTQTKQPTVNKSIKVNALLSMTKQILSILFPMITVYQATRVLGKNNYGMVNYIKANVSYFVLFAGLGIATYAIREGAGIRDYRKKFNRFANEIFTINVYSTLLAIIGLVSFLFFSRMYLKRGEIGLYAIFCLSMILSLVGADWINSIYEDYLYITLRYILIYLIALVILFFCVRSSNDYYLYAGLTVFATYGGNILNVFYIKKYANLRIAKFENCKRHIIPIMVLFSSTIASTIYINSDTTIIGALVGNQAVAVYTVASQIYIAVKHMTNAAVSVTIPRLSYYYMNTDTQKFNQLVSTIFNYAFTLLIPCFVGLFMLSEQCMLFMGGKDYAEGTYALRVLSIALFFAVSAYILSRCILIPLKKDNVYLAATIISAVVNIVLNIWFVPKLMYTGAAITTLISEVIVFCIFLLKSYSLAVIRIEWRDLIKTIIGGSGILLVCIVIKMAHFSVLKTLVLSFLLGALCYGSSILLLRHSLAISLIRNIKNKMN